MRKKTCYATQANYELCKYSTNRGWRDTSRYAKLFGTPERTARTLSQEDMSCRWCLLHDNCKDECLIDDYDALLEWLRGNAE